MFGGITNKISSRPSKPVATVPGEPTGIDGVGVYYDDTYITLFPGTYDGGSPITGYNFYFDNELIPPDDVNDLSFIWYQDLTGREIYLSAVNAIGEGPIVFVGYV